MADDEGSGSALSELESEVEQQQAQQQQEQEQGKRRSTRTATVTARNSKGKQKASDTSALPKRKTGKRKRGQQGAASDEDDNDEATDIPVPSPSHFQQRQQQKQKPQRRRDASTGGHDSNDGGPERDEQGNELEEEDDEESDTVTEDDEHDDDFRGPSTSKRAAAAPAGGKKKGRNGGARTTTATNGRRAAPRQAKKTAPTAAELAAAVRKRGAGAAGACAPGEDDNGDAEQPATSTRNKDDFDIQPDNVIFNTVKNPKSAMEGSVQDWVEQYQADEDSRGEALAELVNFVLRCCGCNLSVDRHEAQDLDGIVDKLDDIQADFSKVQQASYPLASKSKAYKKFRESLHDFFSKFIDACSTSDILYDDVLCETLQSWLVAASSSKLRAFRHTATVLALLLVRALCEVAVGVSKDFADLQKQKDTEVKKRKADQSRLKVLEGRIKDTHSNKIKIERYFKEIFDAVFVHRYRDAEPSIRMECIKALGGWMDVLPDYFLEGNYLRYIGWMLTDLNKEVRHEATDCLSALYDKDVYIGSMSHFTERFKSRLVEMALSDADAGVRCAAVDVLAAIDGHSLLEDEQRDEIATLVYDSEQRVRFAVAPFIRSLVEEELRVRKESLGVERGDFDEDAALTDAQRIERDALLHQRMQYKILAELMVKSAKHLEAKTSSDAAHNDHDDDDDDEGGAPRLGDRARSDMALRRGEGSTSATQLAALLQGQDKDRLTMAIECLRKDVVLLQNWQSILDYLMLDHSASSDGGASETATTGTYSNGGMRPPKQTGSQKQQDQTEGQPSGNQADKNYRLEEDEETLMLGALVSSIRTAHYRATLLPVTADDERDKILETLTRSLVRTLPALFARHQADPTRCLLLLVLPQQMKLDMYLDMRVVSSYESLWDDVTKQYLSHTDVLILERAMETIRFFAAANSLAATNKEKKAQLEQAVLAPLRKIASEVELHKAVLDEDTIGQLETSLTRLTMIAKNWDVTAVMDEKEDGNASSIVDIVTEILDRGSMGFTEEEKMVSRTLELLSIDLLWRIVKLSADEQTPTAVIELRDMLVERATEYALGRGLANIPDGIKTAAFKALLDLRIVAKNRYAATEDPVDEVELDIQAQYRCAGFVQAQIERYASMICASAEDDDIVNESEDELDEEQPAVVGKNRKASAGRGGNNEIDESRSVPFKPQTLAQHAAEYAFNDLIASFSRALCTDVIDLTHASTVLAHHDRFGPFYDECNKWLAEALRHYGVLGDAGSAVAGVVTDSLKAALGLYLKSASRSDAHFVALARLLSNHIVVRKGFSIVKRLPSRDLVSLHTASIDHVASKVATLESQDKNTSRNKALAMFKALTLCAAGLTGKEAASIHAHVVKAFENHSVVPSATSKYWEPYRAYEKKLVSLMSKDTGIKAAARRQVKKTTDASGENGQDSGDGNGREDGEGFKMPRAAKPRAAAKPKTVRETALPSRRSARASNIGTAQYADEDSDVDMDDEEALLPARPQVQKPTARPATRKEAAPAAADTPSAPSTDLADDGDEDDDAVMPGAGRASDTSALPRRKTVPAKRVREASPPPFAGSLLLGGTPTFPAPPSPAAAGTPDAPSVDRASTPEVGQREDDLDSLAGVPDSPPRFSASQMSQQSEETEALPPPGKRRRAMF